MLKRYVIFGEFQFLLKNNEFSSHKTRFKVLTLLCCFSGPSSGEVSPDVDRSEQVEAAVRLVCARTVPHLHTTIRIAM